MSYTSPKQTELTLTRMIPASPTEVYDAWLDAKSPGGPWFGSKRAILDVKVDGLFYHSVAHEGREWAHYGAFHHPRSPAADRAHLGLRRHARARVGGDADP